MDTERAIKEIDHALAALADVKPLADYGIVGTYDTVQARRQRALAQAEQSLLNLRRELSASDVQASKRHCGNCAHMLRNVCNGCGAPEFNKWEASSGVQACPKGKGECAEVLPDVRCFDCPSGVPGPVLPTAAERLRDAAKFLRDEVAGNQPRRAMQYVADELDDIAAGVDSVDGRKG